MTKKNIWSSSQSLMVIFDYKDDDQLKEFRKALDKMLNNSQLVGLLLLLISQRISIKQHYRHIS